jgi:hypothetical protein
MSTVSFEVVLKKFGEFKQPRGLLRRRLWKLGVAVRNFYGKFSEFLGRPSYILIPVLNMMIAF